MKIPKKQSEQTSQFARPRFLLQQYAKNYSGISTVSAPSRVTKATKTFVLMAAGKKITEPSPRTACTPLPWNE
jgi:hypothetical protein